MELKIVNFERDGRFYYNLGLKSVREKEFLKATDYYNKAIKLEPQNPLYYFGLAGVFAELDNIEESVEILENAILKTDAFSDFYYALGCNYFNISKYEQSILNFNKYLKIDPNGSYADASKEALEFIREITKNKIETEKSFIISEKIEESKVLLSKHEFNRAIEVLKDALKINPENLDIYNNLSIVYYMLDRIDLSIDISRKVIKKDYENSFAHVNLALYYKTINNEEFYKYELRKLENIKYNNKEEVLNVVGIISKIESSVYINKLLKKLIINMDDAVLKHFYAISCYNIGNFDEAELIWNKLRKEQQYLCMLIDCFLMKNKKAKDLYPRFSPLCYDLQFFKNYTLKIKDIIEHLLESDFKQFKYSWENDLYIAEITNYCLFNLGIKDRMKILSKLSMLEDKLSIEIINNYAKYSLMEDQVKETCEYILRNKRVAGDNLIFFENYGKM